MLYDAVSKKHWEIPAYRPGLRTQPARVMRSAAGFSAGY